MNYNFIKNPNNNKMYKIQSKLGKKYKELYIIRRS